ncbi:hypothetical protein CUMW_132560 [Citrus unshiu]|uniref:ATP-dependent RNA helicase n=1 Tax=Citrus unshiu TaxID=55188 RepID=A0A2H5PFR8_CITUN|nr:hypothetical protein CUMW_132560 [Citrus unshiu]
MEEAKKKSVPVLPWMRSPVDVSLFEDCPLDHLPCLDPSPLLIYCKIRLKVALQNMGISSLFPVQVAVWQETIGPGLFERDLCINSPTGSGKTLSYALPIVQTLSNRAVRCLRALVVLPTRDLALQVNSARCKYCCKNIFGLIADHSIAEMCVQFDSLLFISLPQVKDVFAAIAPAVGLSVGLAVGQSSIADEISELIKRPKLEAGICYDPEDVLQELQSAVDILVATPGRLMDHINATRGFTLEHLCYLVVDETDRLLREAYQAWLPTVLQLTRSDNENRFSDAREEKCIVFTSSVESTHRLCTLLNHFGELRIKIKEYSGLQRQSVRSKTLKAFREGKIQVLVSSDAMTRGMDVEGVNNVVNYDKPAYIKTYIHRAGRTARAGQLGRCFTLLHKDEVKRFKKLLQKADNDSCPIHSIPSSLIESLRPVYKSALDKLKETVESEAHRKHTIGFKLSRMGKGRVTGRAKQ